LEKEKSPLGKEPQTELRHLLRGEKRGADQGKNSGRKETRKEKRDPKGFGSHLKDGVRRGGGTNDLKKSGRSM